MYLKKIKKCGFFFYIIICTGFVIGLKIGIFPPDINLQTNINEKVCKNVYLSSDSKVEFFGETRWSEKKPEIVRNINYYSKKEPVNLSLEYPKEVSLNKNKSIEICVLSKKSGEYYGALLYITRENYAGVGSWLYLNVSGENKDEDSFTKITGRSLELIESKRNNSLELILFFSTVLLTITFLVLIKFEGYFRKR